MRIISLVVVVILISLLVFTYFKATKKVLDENVNVPGTTDTRIEHTKKTVEGLNKTTEEQKKAVDKLLKK